MAQKKTMRVLKKLLGKCRIKYSSYGRGPTKSLEELLHEWRIGETDFFIEKRKLIRFVRRSQIRVRYCMPNGQWLVLVETHQDFANGSTRTRSRKWSVAEKATRRESPKETAVRGIKDELSLLVAPQRLKRLECESEPEKISSSYPGLLTRYESTRYELILTEEEFREEYMEVQPGRKTTYFSWKKEESKKGKKKA